MGDKHFFLTSNGGTISINMSYIIPDDQKIIIEIASFDVECSYFSMKESIDTICSLLNSQAAIISELMRVANNAVIVDSEKYPTYSASKMKNLVLLQFSSNCDEADKVIEEVFGITGNESKIAFLIEHFNLNMIYHNPKTYEDYRALLVVLLTRKPNIRKEAIVSISG